MRRWPWEPPSGLLVLAGLVVLSGVLSAPELVDAATGGPVTFAHLDRPLGYLALAPLFGLWDSLSLLTLTQHYAVLATLVLLYAWRRIRASRSRLRIPGRWGMEAVRAGGGLALLLSFYAAGFLLPRPMVGIALNDAERLALDFHSHTNHSHDGRGLFTADRNRDWHEGGGFNVAYVTDHYTWLGVDDAVLGNPDVAGERVVLLSGAEMRLRRRHTVVLGDRTRYAFALDSTWRHLDPDSLQGGLERGGQVPTMIYTIPGPLDEVVPFTVQAAAGVVGIELSDGAPRGLEQVKRERSLILAIADSLDLAVVAGSNLHGWGRTVAAWSVMEIPGWRELEPLELGDAVETLLHRDRREAVTVVERPLPYHGGSSVGLAFTLPWLFWEHLRTMSLGERVSWLVWLTVATAVVRLSRPRDPVVGRS